MIDDTSSGSCGGSIIATKSKVSIDFIFKSIYQPSIIINEPNIIIDVNSNITSKNHHHHDNTSNVNIDNMKNNHDDDDDNRTSYHYTGRHDNGNLPILKTSNKEALELLSCLLEAKNKCDNYLTSCIDIEYGYNNNNNNSTNQVNNNSGSSKDLEGEAEVVDVEFDAIAVVDDDNHNDDESSVVTKKIKLDDSSCKSKAIN